MKSEDWLKLAEMVAKASERTLANFVSGTELCRLIKEWAESCRIAEEAAQYDGD